MVSVIDQLLELGCVVFAGSDGMRINTLEGGEVPSLALEMARQARPQLEAAAVILCPHCGSLTLIDHPFGISCVACEQVAFWGTDNRLIRDDFLKVETEDT